VVGSSGVEYALLAAWEKDGSLPSTDRAAPIKAAERIAVVSGSCSPTTEGQIRAALAEGFTGIPLDFVAVSNGDAVEDNLNEALQQAGAALSRGSSPLIYTALGPASIADGGAPERVSQMLSTILRRLMDEHGLERVVVAGGDTSSFALSALDVYALTLRQSIPETPGSPVCLAHLDANGASFEIALKGGQVGKEDYFVWLRDGE